MKFSNYFKESSRNGLTKSFVDSVDGVRIVNMKELFGYNPITDSVEMRMVELGGTELVRFKLQKNDLLFGRRSLVESGAGKTTIFKGDKPTVFESSIIRVRLDENKVNPDFANYYFLSPFGRGNVLSIITGAAVFGIRSSDLNNLNVDFPDLPTQQKIASILSAYDDLIENNNQRIKLLEEMAEEIYKEWFVRMRFPNYKSSKFFDKVGNEVPHGTKGALPEGWGISMLEDILTTVKRKPKVSKDKYLGEGDIPVIDQSDSLISGYVNDKKFLQNSPLPLLVFGDHTRRVKYVDFPFASGADGTQLLYPHNENLLPTFFYLMVARIDLSNFHYARHFKFLKKEKVLVPKDDVLIEFNQLTSPFLKEIELLRNKNQVLQETRDLLLPRLISGKLSVEDIKLSEA